jgi:hypothetical protein
MSPLVVKGGMLGMPGKPRGIALDPAKNILIREDGEE